ncbi:MAG: hypothetical protein PUF49_11390 [Firmicutes bacterium]|nr:hypothetical protein [Bacillota bacterium]
MTNAEWMIINKIDFFRLACKRDTTAKDSFDIMLDDKKISTVYTNDTSEMNAVLAWLDMKHKEPILDDAERRYLSTVIKPLRDSMYYITKISSNDMGKEYISIGIKDGDSILFPWFAAGTMYKGMKAWHEYTLEELGL